MQIILRDSKKTSPLDKFLVHPISLQAIFMVNCSLIFSTYGVRVIEVVVSQSYRLRPVNGFFAGTLDEGFFLVKPDRFFANQSEMSGKSFDWLNMFIDDCISWKQIFGNLLN